MIPETPIDAEPVALITGASSPLGRALSFELSRRGYAVDVAGRDGEALQRLAEDLARLGGRVRQRHVLDLADSELLQRMFETYVAANIVPAVVVIGHGLYRMNSDCPAGAEPLRSMVRVNFESAMECARRAAQLMGTANRGTIVVVSSVSAVRARPRNSLYGATKAALEFAVEGLRVECLERGVRVLTVRAGPISGGGVPRDRHWLRTSPDEVAAIIAARLEQGGDVVYAPRWWAPLMWLVKQLPRWVIARAKL